MILTITWKHLINEHYEKYIFLHLVILRMITIMRFYSTRINTSIEGYL